MLARWHCPGNHSKLELNAGGRQHSQAACASRDTHAVIGGELQTKQRTSFQMVESRKTTPQKLIYGEEMLKDHCRLQFSPAYGT
jgi:hypothetical protein